MSAPRYWESGDDEQSFRWNNYLNRFHARHTDLMDVLAGYQTRAFAPLDEIAQMLGFPGKARDGRRRGCGMHTWPATPSESGRTAKSMR